MKLDKGTTIVVADGEKFAMFKVTTAGDPPILTALPAPDVTSDNKSGGSHHISTSANPDESRLEEDTHSVAVVEWLNKQAQAGKFDALVVIAPPKALGEMRKHYHKTLSAVLVGELAKELSNHSTDDIAKALAAA